VNKIQRMFHSLMVSIIFFTPGNVLALSDIDTTFSVQQHGQEKSLRCDFVTIVNGNLKCTEGVIVIQIPVSNIKQLDVVYLGKEFKVSDINQNDIKSLNEMSEYKEQAISEKKALVAQERKKREAEEAKNPETKRIALCKEVASAAKTIMEKRQDEIPMYKLIEIVHNKEKTKVVAEAFKTIIEQAYSESAMRTPENRIRQQDEFSNKIFRQCYSRNN
jgi:hypothetical protein